MSPRRSLAKSLLSDAVSHSSLAWSEFWFDRSGDLAAALRGGGGTTAAVGTSSGPGGVVVRGKGGAFPSAPLAAFSLSCLSLRNRGGLSCCCARPCLLLRGRSPSSMPPPAPRAWGGRGPGTNFSFEASLPGGSGPGGGFLGARDLAGGLQPGPAGGGGRPPPRPLRDGTPRGVKTRPPRVAGNRAGAGDGGAPGCGGATGT